MPTMKEDIRMLAALLDSGKLTDDEHDAFSSMLSRLEEHVGGRPVYLSEKQRKWVESVYNKLRLKDQEGCANLYSNGVGHPDPNKPVKKYPWELAPKPLAPPGRKPNF